MSSRIYPEKDPLIVHYANPTKTATLCDLETKDAGGPRWVTPGAKDSKKYVDCPLCIQTHTQQKNPS